MWQRAKPNSLRLLHHELAVALLVLACKVHSCFMSRLCAQNCIVVVSDFSLGLLLGREDHLPSCRYHPPLITATQLLPSYRCRLRVSILNHANGAVLHQTAALSFSNFLVSKHRHRSPLDASCIAANFNQLVWLHGPGGRNSAMVLLIIG